MEPWIRGFCGTPASVQREGGRALAALEEARGRVAGLVGGDPAGVIFTSGATEANNLAIFGIAGRRPGRHVIASAVEHISVLNPCRALEQAGYRVSFLPVDSLGRVDPDEVARAIRRGAAGLS